jgi:hypothetical protein
MADIAAKVKSIIVDKLGVDEKEVTPEASFTNDRTIRPRKSLRSVRPSNTSRKT